MGWMMVFWVVLIVAVPTVIWFLLSERRKGAGNREDSPAKIVLRRYLSGDIDLEEYERRIALLSGSKRRGYR
jgi:uncharacterized membrane protein